MTDSQPSTTTRSTAGGQRRKARGSIPPQAAEDGTTTVLAVVAAHCVTITPPPSPGVVAQEQTFQRGAILPAWVPAAHLQHLASQRLVRLVTITPNGAAQ